MRYRKYKTVLFGPLDQYAQNTTTQKVHSIKPEDNFVPKPKKLSYYEKNSNISKEEQARELEAKKQELLEKQKQERNNSLKNKLEELKSGAKEFKKSDKFKTKKEEIKDQILNLPKEEFVINNLDTSFANYTNPGTSDVILPGGMSTPDCVGATPCYDQFEYDFFCVSGCAPTAWMILYGYYNSHGYSNLFSGSTPRNNNSYIEDETLKLIDYMGTTCVEGGTDTDDVEKGINYFNDKYYFGGTTEYEYNKSTSFVFDKVKNEINNGRPILLMSVDFSENSDAGHIMVGFGYKSTGYGKIVRVNLGWGGEGEYYGYYYFSNLDINMDNVYFNGDNQPSINSYVSVELN